jgi:hypothetical protein
MEISTDRIVEVLEDPKSSVEDFNRALIRIKTIKSLQQ